MTLRLLLLVVSLITGIWILTQIRKSKVKIEDSVFWLLFSLLLVAMSLFPDLVELAADLVGVTSPSNLVFLAIIFILMIKIFRLSLRLSQLESRLQTFAQTYALQTSEEFNNLAFTDKSQK